MILFLIAVIFVGILFFSERLIAGPEGAVAKDGKKTAACDRFEFSAVPDAIFLHNNGQQPLMPEKGRCAEIAIVSNSPFTLTFRTRNPDGNIRSGAGLELYTCYSVRQSGLHEEEPWSPAWRQGAMLRNITEHSDHRYTYNGSLCVVAHKDMLPGSQEALEETLLREGQVKYEDAVIVSAVNSKGSTASFQVQVVFQATI